MSIRAAVLKEGHRHNTVKSVDARIRNVNRQPSLGPAIQKLYSLEERIVWPYLHGRCCRWNWEDICHS